MEIYDMLVKDLTLAWLFNKKNINAWSIGQKSPCYHGWDRLKDACIFIIRMEHIKNFLD